MQVWEHKRASKCETVSSSLGQAVLRLFCCSTTIGISVRHDFEVQTPRALSNDSARFECLLFVWVKAFNSACEHMSTVRVSAITSQSNIQTQTLDARNTLSLSLSTTHTHARIRVHTHACYLNLLPVALASDEPIF